MSRLSFDPEKHEYRLGRKVLPSVTQLIRQAGLMDDSQFTEYARSRGQAVHLALHYLDENDLDWDTVDKAVVPYVLAYLAFKKDSQAVVLASEQIVYSRLYGYAGTLDRILELNGRACIADLKTGQPPDWAGVQLAGYQQAAKESGFETYGNFVLWLRPDNTYRLMRKTETVNDFLYVLQKARANEQRASGGDGHEPIGERGGGPASAG